MVVCDWQEFFDGGDGAVDGAVRSVDLAALEADAEIACATHVWATTAALMYRRSLVEKIGGFREDLPVIQDARFLFDAAYHGARFAHSPHVGARHRLSPQSLSRRDPARFWRDALLNGKQIEALWRTRGALTSRQMTALADIYNGAAHGLFRAADPAFREALAALRASGLPVSSRNRLAELLSDVAGHRRAVRVAELLDKIATHRHRHVSTTADLPISPGVESVVGLIELADAVPARIATAASADVLHVPYTYFPDAVGGTEVYVAGLAETLRPFGVHSAIAAPGEVDDTYLHDDVPVFRFATERDADLDRAYGAPDLRAAQSFRALIARLRPRIVHLHAHTAAVSVRLVDAAHEAGAKVVLTYHTPTVSCARGTMMWMGRAPCDGKLDRRRCTLCTLAQHGVPPLFRDAIARTPQAIGDALGRAGLSGGAFTALRLASLIGAGHRRFAELARKVDRIVAPCRWVGEVLRRNGVPENKLVLCRQGLCRHPGRQALPQSNPDMPGLRAGC